ncbi:MAG: glycosyltransferase, partial [Verrucomicrobia bacterium]|nr:glycosyltransferase [Verrucomicrobiota bacterium]
DVFIKAMLKTPDDTHALIIGELRETHLLKLVEDLGLTQRVTFLGFRKDAVRLMKLVDAFVMPSLEREGLPRAVIEAMAQERPVVVSNVGGLPELVIDGVSGFVVPPHHPDALAERLCWIRANREASRSMGAKARQRIQSDFNVDSTIDQMLALFRNLAKPS